MRVIVVILITYLHFIGCGYQFQGSGTILPDDVRTIAVKLVENDTTVPGLGPQFTEALRSRFDRYGTIRVVESEDEADALLDTRIVSLRSEVRSVTGDTDVELQSDLIMTVASELRRTNGQILWKDNNLNVADTFASTSDVVVTSSAGFAQGGIGGDTLGSLESREVSRGQSEQSINYLIEEASRIIYLEAVAEDF